MLCDKTPPHSNAAAVRGARQHEDARRTCEVKDGEWFACRRRMSERPVTIAVLNTTDDVIELLRLVFEQRGYVVVSAHLDAIKRGDVDIESFMRQHRPAVIVYDIPPPYDRHWTFMDHMRNMPDVQGIPFVVTTTNERRLREIVDTRTAVHEIVGKPYDLDQIVDAVEAAIRRHA